MGSDENGSNETMTGTPIDLNTFLSYSSFWSPDKLVESAWFQHAPFAFWILYALRPGRVVELGTHHGFSYLAFCQAVRRLGLSTRCFAVDTWAGDEHAGRYSDQVYQNLKDYHDPRFSDFSRLVRARFDTAVQHFDDHSIDLLHIDGRHFYDDAKEDYELWRPKLSSRAIVLFHDTNVRERNFGVWRLWGELIEKHTYFEFLHGHGLGVLGYGQDLPKAIVDFFKFGMIHANIVREIYFRLGLAVERNYARAAVYAQSLVKETTGIAAREVSKPPSNIDKANRLHIHLAAMAPEFLDVRTSLPLKALGRVAGIGISASHHKIELPRLPTEQRKVAILQRSGVSNLPAFKAGIVDMIQKGWMIVSEMDDHPDLINAVHGRPDNPRLWQLLALSHACQTSTPELAQVFKAHVGEVAVFPNAAFTLGPRPARPTAEDKLRVFYGALNRERFSAQIGRALADFARHHRDLEFVVVHDRAFFEALGEANKRFVPALPYDGFLHTMAGCNVALMPLEGTPGERYKSDIKFVEASSLGLVSVASPVVYGKTIQDGVTGLLVPSVEGWPAALAQLRSDPALRATLATAAYDYVAKERMFSLQIDRRISWYETLWDRRHELTALLAARIRSL